MNTIRCGRKSLRTALAWGETDIVLCQLEPQDQLQGHSRILLLRQYQLIHFSAQIAPALAGRPSFGWLLVLLTHGYILLPLYPRVGTKQSNLKPRLYCKSFVSVKSQRVFPSLHLHSGINTTCFPSPL